MSENITKLLEEALKNIREDREITMNLVADVSNHIGNSSDRHREVGIVAAKYLETLQRSNEQIVKIAELMRKKNNRNDLESLEKEEIEEAYEELEGKKSGQ